MDASCRRLGVPPATAHWIAHLDDQGPTAVRSPWALETWRRSGYHGFGVRPSKSCPSTFIRERGTPQGDVSSPHAWTAFFDIALLASATTDPSFHFRMPTSRSDSALVSDIGYADDLVSLSSSLAGLQHKADLMSAFALLFDVAISAPKLRAVCLGPTPPHPTLTIHGPGWTPTVIPVRTQGNLTILGLTIRPRHPPDLAITEHPRPSYTGRHYPWCPTCGGHVSPGCIGEHHGEGSIHCAVRPMDSPGVGCPRRPTQQGVSSPSATAILQPKRSPLYERQKRGPGPPTALGPSKCHEMGHEQPAPATGRPSRAGGKRTPHKGLGTLGWPVPTPHSG